MQFKGCIRLALVPLGVLVAEAEDMPVPTDIQVAIFKKIFSYDRSAEGAVSLDVLVVHGGESNLAEDVAGSFEAAGIPARTVPLELLSEEIDLGFAVYVLPGATSSQVRELCRERRVMSISGAPELAERGEVSVAIGQADRKPEIVIHLNRLRSEGHELSSAVLGLARVIR